MKKINLQKLDLNKLSVKKKGDSLIVKAKHSYLLFINKSHKLFNLIKNYFLSFTKIETYNVIMFSVLILSIIVTLFVTIPLESTLMIFKKGVTEKDVEILVLQQNITEMKEQEQNIDQIKTHVETMKKIIPNKQNEEDVISTLERILVMNSMSVPKRFVWEKLNENFIYSSKIKNNFNVYSYSFSSFWDFNSLKRFLKSLKNNLRIIDIKSIKIVPQNSSDYLKSDITVWSYDVKPNN